MIKRKFKNLKIIILFFICFSTINTNQLAAEILIYADDISYDKKKNIIAKGSAKIIHNNKIISSDLIIFSKETGDIILPKDFRLRDERNNYYFGSKGYFSKDLNQATINDVKVLLNDGSRIVGKIAKRDNNIDIITKAVYSPCNSKIKIANFLCPIWQLEGEKMLHDYDNLFLYQKHSKMRVMNMPVFYLPYLVTPSPLRKKRKSGFLTPSINFNFFDTKVSQSTSLPYYFNISEDKELTFIPTINYGGGVDSSQRFNFDYNQLLSGGNLSTYLTIDSTFENSNNEKWLKEGSIINSFENNLNDQFKIKIFSALQTSKNYIQKTNPNDELSYSSSLKSSITLSGYNIRKLDDELYLNITSYQSNQNNEDNKTIPSILPHIIFDSGSETNGDYYYASNLEFYNIYRDKHTTIHSKQQRKLSSKFTIGRKLILNGIDIKYSTNIYNQFFSTEDKLIDKQSVNSSYYRIFPIMGLFMEVPFRFKNDLNNLMYTPKISIILTPGTSNTNKISNEDSSVNTYSIENNSEMNRYTGTDKLDNSKRINLGLEINNEYLESSFFQAYEFTDNSNFHYSQGNKKKLSDFLGKIKYDVNKYGIAYNFRYDSNEDYIKSQNLDLNYNNKIGNIKLSYLDQKSKTDEIITSDNETLNYTIDSKKINKYSKISYYGLYDLKNSTNKESGISYSYFDECFGVNIDFKRNSYTEDELKPQDILTIMFSFKNVGSYKSSNLAVSESDKQEIEWLNMNIDNELFN